MLKKDYSCPVCKANVGPPSTNPTTRCAGCGEWLVIVRVIGTDTVHLHYRRKSSRAVWWNLPRA